MRAYRCGSYFDVDDSFFGDEAIDEADADVEAFGYLVFVEEWVGVPESELVHGGSFHRGSVRDRVAPAAPQLSIHYAYV